MNFRFKRTEKTAKNGLAGALGIKLFKYSAPQGDKLNLSRIIWIYLGPGCVGEQGEQHPCEVCVHAQGKLLLTGWI